MTDLNKERWLINEGNTDRLTVIRERGINREQGYRGAAGKAVVQSAG
jgi:hypothetical protein